MGNAMIQLEDKNLQRKIIPDQAKFGLIFLGITSKS
jgi:hypothetical protein